MEKKPLRGNGTVCTLAYVKIKSGAASQVWHEFYGNMVWTVNSKDVEWLAVELSDDSEEISGIKSELDQLKQNSNINELSKNEWVMTLEKLIEF